MNEMDLGERSKTQWPQFNTADALDMPSSALPELRLSLGECRHAGAETGAEAQLASFSFRLIGFSFVLWNLTALVVTSWLTTPIVSNYRGDF